MRILLSIIICFFFVHPFVWSQSSFLNLNELPSTELVRAPVFDVTVKYHFSIDSSKQVLFIQGLRQEPTSGEYHFHQMIYEISLKDLNKGSIRTTKETGEEKILLKIGVSKNSPNINEYFINSKKVAILSTKPMITLGKWNLSEEVFNEIADLVKEISQEIPDDVYSTNLFSPSKSVYKYGSSAATILGEIDSNKELADGYSLGPSIDPSFVDYYPKATEKLQKILVKNGIELGEFEPILIRVDEKGKISSAFLLNHPKVDFEEIQLNEFLDFKSKIVDQKNIKTKHLIIL